MIPSGPIAIGGVGGSGTRLIAHLLNQAGLKMGDNTNRANDCLYFAFLFAQPDVLTIKDEHFAQRFELLKRAILDQSQPDFAGRVVSHILDAGDDNVERMRSSDWREKQAAKIMRANTSNCSGTIATPWGWKAPSTHIALDRLSATCASMKYVHVVRNGLDMAFSKNTRQLRVWGSPLFGLDEADLSPANLLAYWARANRRAIEIGENMADNFLLLSFDAMLAHPTRELPRLLEFSGLDVSQSRQEKLMSAIQRPSSLGRAIGRDFSSFAKEDIEAIGALGFDTYGA